MNPANENTPGPDDAKAFEPCPICGKPGVKAYRPFCSKRCSDVDLHRWLSGRYAVPAVEGEGEGEGPDEDEPGP
jgi:endogenous inhibitor of DNA gyrase (YacG/DUF329 family)